MPLDSPGKKKPKTRWEIRLHGDCKNTPVLLERRDIKKYLRRQFLSAGVQFTKETRRELSKRETEEGSERKTNIYKQP